MNRGSKWIVGAERKPGKQIQAAGERVRENSQNAALIKEATPDFKLEQCCRNDGG